MGTEIPRIGVFIWLPEERCVKRDADRLRSRIIDTALRTNVVASEDELEVIFPVMHMPADGRWRCELRIRAHTGEHSLRLLRHNIYGALQGTWPDRFEGVVFEAFETRPFSLNPMRHSA